MLYVQVTVLWYPGASFGSRIPQFVAAKLEIFPQLISNEVRDCIPNIYWIYCHVFELRDLQLLKSAQFFTPDRVFC